MSVHPTAARGFQGELYERGRPGYPEEAVDELLRGAGAGPGALVVDLGAGTGKLTRIVAGRVRSVIALDPVVDMLATLRRVGPGIPTAAGVAEAIPIASASVDAVVCAAAFHWFRTTEALLEIHRVLRPDGGLGLVWNRRDLSIGWVARLWGQLIEPRRGQTPAHDAMEWRAVLEASELFGPVSQRIFAHGQPCDVDTLIARIDSTSFINTLPADEKAALFDRIRSFCATDPELAGRDVFELPYRTFVYTCRRG